MKKVESRVSATSIPLDFEKLKDSQEPSEEISCCRTEKGHKIITLRSTLSIVERVVLLESLSDDFGPPTRRRSDSDGVYVSDEDDDATDVESELVNVAAPILTVDARTPLEDRRPCDPVAKFLLSKC